MLMNHKYFHFTQFLDKTNDVIFFKSPKIMFLGDFWPFLVIFDRWGFFPKNPALLQITRYGPNTMLSFTKKLMSQFWENLQTDGRTEGRIDRQMEGRTDGQTLFYRTLSAEAWGPIKFADIAMTKITKKI